jgi:hypothetical protein
VLPVGSLSNVGVGSGSWKKGRSRERAREAARMGAPMSPAKMKRQGDCMGECLRDCKEDCKDPEVDAKDRQDQVCGPGVCTRPAPEGCWERDGDGYRGGLLCVYGDFLGSEVRPKLVFPGYRVTSVSLLLCLCCCEIATRGPRIYMRHSLPIRSDLVFSPQKSRFPPTAPPSAPPPFLSSAAHSQPQQQQGCAPLQCRCSAMIQRPIGRQGLAQSPRLEGCINYIMNVMWNIEQVYAGLCQC